MKLARTVAFASIAIPAALLSGCALDRYQPVQAHLAGAAPARTASAPVIFLEPAVAGKPFDEIVADNVTGEMWDPAESQRIGFTQNYSDTLAKQGPTLAVMAAMPAPTAAGYAASGQSGLNISSRILVPYGRFIADNLGELIAQSAPNAALCLDQQCVQAKLQAEPGRRVVTVRFTRLSVAENVRNTLTLVVEGTASYGAGTQAVNAPIRDSIVDRSITSEGLWHSDFLRAMNKMANEISSSVAQQIFTAATQG